MKKLSLIVLLILFPKVCWSQGYAMVSHGIAQSTDQLIAQTTGSTTGADFIYVAIAFAPNAGNACTFTDSVGGQSNTWTMVTDKTDGTHTIRGFYVQNPAHVGASHTFKCDSTAFGVTYPSIAYVAYSGSSATPLDVQDSNSATSVTSMTAGASGISPSQNNELILTGLLGTSAVTMGINPSFSTPDTPLSANANAYGIGLGVFVQGTAAMINPTWTFGSTMGTALTNLVSFKGTTPTTPPWYSTSWAHRFPVTITNNEGRPLSYYHPTFTFTGSNYTNLNSCAKMDRSDLRVTDSDGITLLNFWLEDTTLTNSVMLTVKAPYIPTSNRKLYVYCGNPLAVSVSTATNTIQPSLREPYDATPSIVIENGAGFNGYGRLGKASDGTLTELYAAGGSNQSCLGCPLMIRHSTDNGATWGASSQLIAGVMGEFFSPATTVITTLASGTMITFLAQTAGRYVYYSNDKGTTWTKSASTVAIPSGFNGMSVTPHSYSRIIEASPGGTLYSLWYGYRTADSKASVVLYKCTSTCTNDANWGLAGASLAASTVLRDAAQSLDYNEADLAMPVTGHFTVVSRVDSGAGGGAGDSPYVWIRSTDSGATWGSITTLTDVTGVKGGAQVSPELVTTNNCNNGTCNILLLGGERTRQNGSYLGLLGSLSTDEGQTWTQLFLIGETASPGDMAYSSTLQIANGNIYTTVTYGNANGGGSSAGIIYGIPMVEDTYANPKGYYRDGMCSNFTCGAQATDDGSAGHGDAASIKMDNNGGTAPMVTYTYGSDTTGYPTRATAIGYWLRMDAVTSGFVNYEFQNDGSNVNTGNRFFQGPWDFVGDGLPYDVVWFASSDSSWHNYTVAQTGTVNTGIWHKYQVRANTLSNSSLTGGLSFDDVLAGNNGTNSANGTTNDISHIIWLTGSNGGTHNMISHLDDVYTDQWLGTTPTFAIGVEENAPVVTAAYKLLLKVGK